MVGRPPTPAAIRKGKVGSIRLTAAEEAHLVAKYGKASTGLRRLLQKDIEASKK